ncbi:MAG TPA: class I adenylate-forming enzyme family protein [Acidimicrobiales bacterium]
MSRPADAETIPALLALRHRTAPDLPALVTDEATISYAELDDASADLAARLTGDGVVKGDRVAWLAPNGIEWAVTAYAVWRVGAVLVPLSTLLRPPELLAQLTTASVTHLLLVPTFRGRSYLDDVEEAAPGLLSTVESGDGHPSAPTLQRVWTSGQLPEAAAPATRVRAMENGVRASDDLVVLFTSGSTGDPKGTIHTHGGGLRAVAAGLEARGIGSGERLYIPMPFFWTGGLCGGLLSTLLAGATLLTEAEPDPDRTLHLLEREQVTLFRGWPDQAAKLAAHPAFAAADLSSLGDASLGAVLPAERRPAPGARANLFGMTETFGPYCGDRLDTDLPPDEWGSCGRPFAGIEVRIAEDGEICVRGPNLMRGVCGRSRNEVFASDGWFRTGDRGRLDDAGYLWYEGRLDDMFKVKGATVYPSEVEAAVRSIDDVRQAHVTEVDGEVGALVVTALPVTEVEAATRERLSAFKVPSRWRVTADGGEVPVTATGKVDKAALRTLIADSAKTSRGIAERGDPGGVSADVR